MANPVPTSGPGAAAVPDDSDFKRSYEEFQRYPEILVRHSSYQWTLKGYSLRLEEQDLKLFSKDKFEVPFRDYIGNGANGGFDKQNCYDELDLKTRLGDLTSSFPPGSSISRKDPKCRFIFFSAPDSREPLRLSRSMLLRILTYHQVMSEYLEFLTIFGEKSEKNEARDLRYSGFREQTRFEDPPQSCKLPDLGRSGRQFQLCYNLKSVTCKSDLKVAPVNKDWTIRQGVFHHQFDIEEGTTLWIVAQGRKDIKERIQSLTGAKGRPGDRDFSSPAHCFRSSLAVHLLYCHWSMEGWCWYVQWLEEVIEEKTSLAIRERRGADNNYVYSPKDVQSVQYFQDRIKDAIVILEANTNVLISLRNFYQSLLRNKDFRLKTPCKGDIIAFANEVDVILYDSRMHIARAKVLAEITADRKSLVLVHLQSQATEKQSKATEEMERLTQSMHRLGLNAQKEAIAVRIITVVTLIFLPAAFVSTFFSTDVVKYQNQQGGTGDIESGADPGSYMGSFSAVALERWLEVTIPLTTLTLGIGYLFFKRVERGAKRNLEKLGLLPIYEEENKNSKSWMHGWCNPFVRS